MRVCAVDWASGARFRRSYRVSSEELKYRSADRRIAKSRYSNKPEPEPPPQYVSPGHFSSPVPSAEDLARALAAVTLPAPMLGIDM